MSNTILTDEKIGIIWKETLARMGCGGDPVLWYARAIEQYILQSPNMKERMEAYADAKVRKAVEQAESMLRCSADLCKNPDLEGFLNVHADAIHSLIPKE